MAFYEGIDEEIYEGGDHYVPMERFRLNKFVPTVKTTPVTSPTSTSYGLPTIYPYGGEGDYQGGGLFGNLDLSNTKTFTKDVWSEWGPGKGGWKKQEVTGYLNPKTGQYQTFEGKNINHLGIEIPTIAGALLDKNFGKGPQLGDIKGTFTDGWDSGIENIKEGWDEEKDKWSGILGIDKAKAFFKGKKENQWKDITDIDSQENQPGGDGGTTTTTTTNQNQTGGGDGGGGSKFAGDSGAASGTTGSWSPGGTYEAPSRHHALADGGRIGFFDSISGMRDALRAMGYDWIDAADDLTVRQIFNSEKGTWTASDVWRPGKKEGGRIGFSGGGSYLPRGMWAEIREAYKQYEEENKDSVGPLMSYKQFWNNYIANLADGGRVGLNYGGLASIL